MDHVIDGHDHHHHGHNHGHRHDHAHGHNHGHDHDHDHGHSMAEYFTEQLMMVFISGAFGVVGILMYRLDMLKHILVPDFFIPVLAGSIVLLGLAMLRGIALWQEAGQRQAEASARAHEHHHHDHKPGETCDHPSHADDHYLQAAHAHAHSHDHYHAHGFVYARVILLCFPLLLFALGVPNGSLSHEWNMKRLGDIAAIGDIKEVAAKDGSEPLYDFASIVAATLSEERMQALEGTPARIKGQIRFVPNREKEFELFQMKMTCCITDVVPLQARIFVARPSMVAGLKPGEWVEVSGTLQFHRIPGRAPLTIISVRDEEGVRKTNPVY